jgi:hypothetical protein
MRELTLVQQGYPNTWALLRSNSQLYLRVLTKKTDPNVLVRQLVLSPRPIRAGCRSFSGWSSPTTGAGIPIPGRETSMLPFFRLLGQMIIFGLEVVQSSSSAMMDGSTQAWALPGGASWMTLIWDSLRLLHAPFSLLMVL